MKYEPQDSQVKALIDLCEKEGGFSVVAKRAKISRDALYQIISGVRLPSGNFKGVGPKTRAALDKRYPNWLIDSSSNQGATSWPFEEIRPQEWDLLPERAKGAIEERIRVLVEQYSRAPQESHQEFAKRAA